MKKYFTLLLTIALNTSLFCQIVTIPDANFKNYLLSNAAINSNLDTEIQVTEANAFNGTLNIDNMNIADLTGIETFINMTGLICSNNQLTSIDISNSPGLALLGCGGNLLTILNITNNTNLSILGVNFNQLTTLDVTNNIALTQLDAVDNLLTTIDLSNNVNLNILSLSQNNFTSVNLNSNINLQQIHLENTPITSIDLSNNPILQGVWLDTNINLATLNIKNGNNTGVFVPSFLGNPNLTCIQVDDSAWALANWTNKDAIASYSTNCSVGIEEENEKDIVIYPNPASNYVNVVLSNKEAPETLVLQLIDVTGKIVQKSVLSNAINKINTSDLPNGYYHLLVSNSSGNLFSKKLIITP